MNLLSNARTLKGINAMKTIALILITAFVTSLGQALGFNEETFLSLHVPTKLELFKAVSAAISAGLAYIIKNYFWNTVPNAVKTVEQAGGTVTPSYTLKSSS